MSHLAHLRQQKRIVMALHPSEIALSPARDQLTRERDQQYRLESTYISPFREEQDPQGLLA